MTSERTAGLYHTAFLMPTRQDHARWILHIARSRTPITGASDHGVSEAFYLDDPEGNGIEVYSDRPPESWLREGDMIVMPTKPLDIEAILRRRSISAAGAYTAAPEGLRIGHVHLRVGSVAQAEGFYHGAMGLDVTRAEQSARAARPSCHRAEATGRTIVGANIWQRQRSPPARAIPIAPGLPSSRSRRPTPMDARRRAVARLKSAKAPITGRRPAASRPRHPWGTRVRFALGLSAASESDERSRPAPLQSRPRRSPSVIPQLKATIAQIQHL